MNKKEKSKLWSKLWQLIDFLVPSYARRLLFAVVAYNFSVYYICRIVNGLRGVTYTSMETEFDKQFPLMTWAVLIYFGCYLFWIANYVICSRTERERGRAFLWADLMGKFVCMILFIVIPTTMARPEIGESGILNAIMRFLYTVDASDNLFPSIHCFVSWLCYIGIRGDKRHPLWYRAFSMIFALLVCFSTLATKQHVIADVISGVALAEICYFLAYYLPRILRKRKLKSEASTEDLSAKVQ